MRRSFLSSLFPFLKRKLTLSRLSSSSASSFDTALEVRSLFFFTSSASSLLPSSLARSQNSTYRDGGSSLSSRRSPTSRLEESQEGLLPHRLGGPRRCLIGSWEGRGRRERDCVRRRWSSRLFWGPLGWIENESSHFVLELTAEGGKRARETTIQTCVIQESRGRKKTIKQESEKKASGRSRALLVRPPPLLISSSSSSQSFNLQLKSHDFCLQP